MADGAVAGGPFVLESAGAAGMVFGAFAVAVAQLVEHWIVAPGVAGSNPVGHPVIYR
jgi:hypothetical protein